ncbi:sulfotransferase [cf. Phormidesmis sp. LEGE 11477]|uniref:sulfotransferase n=1 Tax=cf. Phormidesmis sp. LEGE 11477 TaxID=1828680 RepID=UPI0018811B7F|nr:sulfotransferase [cf. Phormidesmis sp. LEGE 11477]MBE9064724.1 sulfotransferase [cf. Phormidesmis sp. LEGE 11477]
MGTAHCGSTLLTLVLGGHSDCLSLGEISNLPDFYRRNKPICSVCEGECSLWDQKFSDQDLQALVHGFSDRRVHRFIPLKVEKQVRRLLRADSVFNPYSLIASKVEESVLIDSTKTVWWLQKRLAAREFNENLSPYLIHLIRDGRAVMNSYSRRKQYQGLTSQQFGEQFGTLWKNRVTNENNFFDSFSGKKIRLRYEEFATNSEAITQRLCNWLEIEFQPDMLSYWKHQHHTISGNKGTRASVQRYQNDAQSNRNVGIKLNQKWQQRLSAEQIAAFYQVTDGMNKNYEW